MKRVLSSEAVFALVLIAVSLVFFGMAESFNRPTADGSVHEGFFPQIVASVVILEAVIILVGAIRKKTAYFSMTDEQKANLKPLLLIVGLFILYIAAWPYVHFIIQTALLLLAMCRILKMTWRFTAIFTLVFSVGLYFLFTQAFSILL